MSRFPQVVLPLLLVACTRDLDPVDVSDLLIACQKEKEVEGAVAVACNDDFVVSAFELPLFSRLGRQEWIAAFLSRTSMRQTPAQLMIQGEVVEGALIDTPPSAAQALSGSIVVRGRMMSACVAYDDVANVSEKCARIHAAVLGTGPSLLRDAAAASARLPTLAPPPARAGCTLSHDDDEPPDAFHYDCESVVIDVSGGAATMTKTLEDAIAAEQQQARDEGAERTVLVRQTCDVAGERGPCATVIDDGWHVFLGTVQTQAGRRLVTCAAETPTPPAGCPLRKLVEGTIETHIVQ